MVFVCCLLLKEANIHINLICFDDNFDHPHVNVVTFAPENSPKSPNFSQKLSFLLKTVFEMYLLLDLFSLFSQNSCAFLKNCYFIAVPFQN